MGVIFFVIIAIASAYVVVMLPEKIKCPGCGGSNLKEEFRRQDLIVRDYGPLTLEKFYYTHCVDCNFEFVTPKQSRAHDIAVSRIKTWKSEQRSS